MTSGTNNGNGNSANKDTVYIDIDDEITGVIDKVRGSEHRIVALVLPKRAAAFQSIVNMRLLKRTADNAKKHVVLITSDTTVTPLAGVVGLHVAKNLQSRPEIPPAPAGPGGEDEAEEIVDMAGESPSNVVRPDRNSSVGDLASAAKKPDDDDLPIELDNTEPLASGPAGDVKKPKGKKDKKLRVPNFGKFRKLLIFGGIGLAALIVLIVLCAIVLPKATITVKTDSIAVNSNLDLTLNPNTTNVNVDAGVVPAQSQQTQKTQTQQVDATGQRNDGTKASGSVTMNAGACSGDVPSSIPAGTGITSNGQTFLTQGGVTFTPSVSQSGKCTFRSTGSTDVVAQSAGAGGNVGAANFTVAGYNGVTAKSDAPMSGGSDKITKIVSQSDIDSAKQKINGQDNSAVKQELQSSLQGKGLYAIPATLNTGTPDVSADTKVGDAADSVTVTEKITYTMLGAKQADLKKLIDNSVNKQIDPTKQKILEYGLDKAVFNPQNSGGGNSLVTMQVTSVAGSALDVDSLKKQVAGKKAADAKSIIKANPSVTDVDVKYSPFWVSSIPKKTSKITIQIEKPTVSNAKP